MSWMESALPFGLGQTTRSLVAGSTIPLPKRARVPTLPPAEPRPAKRVEPAPTPEAAPAAEPVTTPGYAHAAYAFAKENPGTAACYATAWVAVAVMASPSLVSAPLLALSGFGANGVVGGSIAAGVQSGIGNVAVGTVFAVLQSAGAGGAGAAAVASAVSSAAGGIAAAAAGTAEYRRRKKAAGKEDEDEDADEDEDTKSTTK